MATGIKVFIGRLKKVQFTWRETTAPSSPPIDLTGATCTVFSTNLAVAPTIAIIDAVNGVCEMTFSPESTKGLNVNNQYHVSIALTFTSNPGYSPDPIYVEVDLGS